MKRSRLRRGKPLARGGKRLGRRRQASGRPSLPPAEWKVLVAEATRLDRGRCANPYCRKRGPLDPQHVKKRSQGGADSIENVLMLCRKCHDLADNAPAATKLYIIPLAPGTFAFETPQGGMVHERIA